jgi:glycosyltransferase involved in cell wall biosynthesis
MADVSVVIPTYNRKQHLRKAIGSCFEGNENIDVEVVVVDDGSSDGTSEYLEGLDDGRVRPIFQEHQGAQAARNRGTEHARGRYVKYLDDDDYLRPGGLEKQVKVLDETGLPCCYGDCHVKYETSVRNDIQRRKIPSHEDLVVGVTSDLNRWNLLFLLRADLAKQSRWDPKLEMLHIIDYLLRFARQDARCVKIDESVAVHRIHRSERISNSFEQSAASIKKTEFALYDRFLKEVDVTPRQRMALLEKMWEVIHMLAVLSWANFRECYQRFRARAPDFVPSRSHFILTGLDRVFTPAVTERLLYPIRRSKWTFRGE